MEREESRKKELSQAESERTLLAKQIESLTEEVDQANSKRAELELKLRAFNFSSLKNLDNDKSALDHSSSLMN